MKVSYEKSLANRLGLQRRCDGGNNVVLSVRIGGQRRPAIELRNHNFRVPITSPRGEGNIATTAHGEVASGRGGVLEPEHAWTFQAREPGDPLSFQPAMWHITASWNERSTSQRAIPL